jgi:hypothetical protein
MNNYEKICKIINSWHLAHCIDENWDNVLFSTIKSDWCIRRSCFDEKLQSCINSLWAKYDNKEEINNTFTSIRPYTIKPKMLKVWDMVEILETARECGHYEYWSNNKIDMISKWPFEISNIVDNSDWISYKIYNKDKSDYRTYPHYTVCLYTWETKEIETIEILWVKYSKEEVENSLKNLKPL